jgi:hypothetical protein
MAAIATTARARSRRGGRSRGLVVPRTADLLWVTLRALNRLGRARTCRNILEDALCLLKIWSAQCLNWSIVTRARVPRQTIEELAGGHCHGAGHLATGGAVISPQARKLGCLNVIRFKVCPDGLATNTYPILSFPCTPLYYIWEIPSGKIALREKDATARG